MKLAFSTIACPNWKFSEIVASGKDLGFDGVEIRGIGSNMYAPKMSIFQPENLDATNKLLGDFKISLLASNACIAVPEKSEDAIREGKEYIDLASTLGVKYIRVMCTDVPYLDGGDFNTAVENYKTLASYGEKLGVTPLLETNGMFCNTKILAKCITDTGENNVGILWDIHHPYRYGEESIVETFDNIGHFVKYVHIKDSIVEDDKTIYKMLGCGDIPISEALNLLKNSGYDGYITLEWVKRWNKNIEDAGVVLPHFIEKIKEYAILN